MGWDGVLCGGCRQGPQRFPRLLDPCRRGCRTLQLPADQLWYVRRNSCLVGSYLICVLFSHLTEWLNYKTAFKHKESSPNLAFTKVSRSFAADFTGGEGCKDCRTLKSFPHGVPSNSSYYRLQFESQI